MLTGLTIFNLLGFAFWPDRENLFSDLFILFFYYVLLYSILVQLPRARFFRHVLAGAPSFLYWICTCTASPLLTSARAFSSGREAMSSSSNGPYLAKSMPMNCWVGLRNLTKTRFERILAEIDSSTLGLPRDAASAIVSDLLAHSVKPS